MNKPAPSVPLARVLGCLGVGALALVAGISAQQSEPTPAAAEAPSDDPRPDPANDTEILASQGATFTAKDRIAVFNGDVRVRDPRFVLASDKLTVYLAKGAMAAAGATPAPVASPAKPGDANPVESARAGGIDRAVAEGHVTIIQKHAATKPGEEEKVSVGRADIVEYDAKTGDTTLRGMPKVEQNGNSHEALSRSTIMILSSDNSLRTIGPNRTIIMPRTKDSLPGGSPAKSGATPPAVRRPSAGGTSN